MTRREQLQDQYEDALFALLMDDLAWQEGERLLEENERLKHDPSADVPAEVTERCLKVINREFAKRNARKAGRISWNVFKRIVIAACVSMLLFSVAFAASETVRVNTLNLLIDVCDRYTDYRFGGDTDEADITGFSGYEVEWLPEGMTLTDQNIKSDYPNSIRKTYEGPNGEYLNVRLATLTPAGVWSFDTEDAVVEDITVNGWDASLITKDGFQLVIPFHETTQILRVIFATGDTLPDREVFLRIVEGISLY